MTMKSEKSLHIYLLVLLFCLPSFAYSQDIAQSFEIQIGNVTVTPGFCPPETCVPTSAILTGTFSAVISDDSITFSNINVTSTPETGFNLPEAPNDSSGGTNRNATFTYDDVNLTVEGVVDSRAFDGPLYEYKFIAQTSKLLGFDAKGYYTARQDLRLCVFPICGGIFVKSVNTRLTTCADGIRRDECYVATANWGNLGFNPFNSNQDIDLFTPILLKGRLIPRIYEDFGNLGEFVATEAYRPATNNPPEGTFAALINNGITCVTTPCFSIDEYVLNKLNVGVISGFDLNPVGASDDDLSIAYSLFSNHSPLIVTGYNKLIQELNGVGISFIANQIYLPIHPTTQ
jgi:hypothetical protein